MWTDCEIESDLHFNNNNCESTTVKSVSQSQCPQIVAIVKGKLASGENDLVFKNIFNKNGRFHMKDRSNHQLFKLQKQHKQ